MTANEIRTKFLEFFSAKGGSASGGKSKGHRIVASDSLVPKDDPTVLFTTAGMQQFKRQFLGHIDDYTRAATSQKCLRTDDLDKIGHTAFHHTFFEMLGNFSFGDYFKKEAITWGWEFLTQVMQLPAEKLWVSIYHEDKEAEDIWLKIIKIPAHKLIKLGDKNNFWPSEAKTKGPNGPCGPCSEIFFDYGVNPQCTNKHCNPDCDCGRFSEIWNLVFTQFNRKDGGVLEPLPGKNIDTGMGLERLVAVVQGKKNNYETDLFQPILDAIDKETNRGNDAYTLKPIDKYVIADHIRAIVFGISDGVNPSNDGRGYVIKRLIIDATDRMVPIGKNERRLYKLVPKVIEIMESAYPDLSNKSDIISQIIEKFQNSYLITRKDRMPQLKFQSQEILQLKVTAKQKIQELGNLGFLFRDTYGLTFPVIITAIESSIASATTINPDEKEKILQEIPKEIAKQMDRQREKSRASSKMTGDVFVDTGLEAGIPKTEFLGYETMEANGRVLKIYNSEGTSPNASAGETVKIILDRTPFYAESGGQIGDSGILSGKKGKVRILDTQKMSDIFIHTGEVVEGGITVDEEVNLSVDAARRLAIMRNHTATHILQTALRNILGPHVQQQGSLVAEDRLRFDFTHPKAISAQDIKTIEDYVNTRVLNCDSVSKDVMPIEKARQSGALAFFAEKYGSTVRVVSINGYSKEFCGGTHLNSTGQIGLFKIISESAIAQGIRRLEAKTGTGAIEYINKQESALNQISQITKAPVDGIVERIDRQAQRIRQLEKEIEQLQFETVRHNIDQLIKEGQKAGPAVVISHIYPNLEMPILRKIVDLIKQKAPNAVVILGSRCGDNANLLVAVGDEIVKRGVQANTVIAEAAPIIDGNGGGRAQLAQAGGKSTAKIIDAMEAARQMVLKTLNS